MLCVREHVDGLHGHHLVGSSGRVRAYCGNYLLEFDGRRVRRYCGNYIAEVEDGRIREYCGNYLYTIEGSLSSKELLALIAILFAH